MATDGNSPMRLENILQSESSTNATPTYYQPPPISEKTQRELAASAERFMRTHGKRSSTDRSSASPNSTTINTQGQSSSPQPPNDRQTPEVNQQSLEVNRQSSEINRQTPEVKPEENSGNAKRKHE